MAKRFIRGFLDTLTAGAILLAMAHYAKAHDTWKNGVAVPAWVKASCCGPEDVHLLSPEEVHKVDGGYRIDGYPDLIPNDTVFPSQDGNYWAFYRVYPDGSVSHIYCFFAVLGF
jgi:hypothetical protein